MKTVKVAMIEDEWYPVYTFASSDFYDFIVEIPENKYEWLKTVFKAFEKAQDYLRHLRDKKNE